MSINHKMAQSHESYVAQVLGAGVNRGSGNQWRAQMDGRTSRMHKLFAFAWDCKATLAKSMSISRKMWDKAVEQAQGERPALPLRFYDDESLRTYEDLIVLRFEDFAELLYKANEVTPMIVLCVERRDTEFFGVNQVQAVQKIEGIVFEPDGTIRRVKTVSIGTEQPLSVDFVDPDPYRISERVGRVYDLRLDDQRMHGEAIVITQSGMIYRLVSPGNEVKIEMV